MLDFKAINRSCYAMKAAAEEVEITTYGEIVEKRPTNFWTGEPEEGSFIIQDEFLKDLETAVESGAKGIRLRINSLGGDAAVAVTIHNRLRELSLNGIAVSCIVDGLAMSGGSLIMCACDTVTVHPSSLIMIHRALSLALGWFNADEYKDMATQSEAWDRVQAEIYARKTKLSETVITHMMAATTNMTGREAKEKGFADKLTEEKSVAIAASADKKTLFVNGRRFNLPPGVTAPETMVSVGESPDINTPDGEKGGNNMANNLDELRTENPTLAAQVEKEVRAALEGEHADAAAAERRRLREIDEIAKIYDDATVNDAKYENPCTAAEMTFRAAKAAAKAGRKFIEEMNEDNAASGVNDVPSANGLSEKPKTKEGKLAQARADIKALLPKKEE